jgi:hypothetical protein
MEHGTLGDQLFASGWKSGSVIRPEFYAAVAPYLHHSDEAGPTPIDPEDWLIVVSQSCDVVARKDDAEPYIEILRAHRLRQKPRTQLCDLHSTRTLDFLPNKGTLPDTVLSVHATVDRYLVPRKILLGSAPSITQALSDVAIKRLHAWLALRACRPAWPNHFVERVGRHRTRLEGALNPLREEIAEVRVAIAPHDVELDDDTPYKVAVFFVIDPDVFEAFPDARGQIQKCFSEFVAAIGTCRGIDLNYDLSDVRPGDQFTWDEMQRSDLWDFANLTPFE